MAFPVSVTGRLWQLPSPEVLKEAERLTAFIGLNPVIARIYARLGARIESLEAFAEPKLRDLLPDPSRLLDMDEATARILRAINEGEAIAIFADYDVDGASSAALLIEYLRAVGQGATLYVPDRLSEGYGPNTPAMTALAQDHSLIICVDCGTLAFEPIKAARDADADVVILDHHMADERLPEAITVNPNRQDCENDLGYLCAAGVVFLLLVSLNRARQSQSPNLIDMLDIVALATIADVAPLIGVNRAFVRTGLEVMNARKRPGLKAIIDQHLPFRALTPEDIGFTIAPRLNAGGRIGRAQAATELLTAQNEAEIGQILAEMEAINTERRAIEAKITEEAIAQIEANPARSENFVYALGENWHPGVLGIVAARVKSEFGKPAIVLTAENGTATGSARSITGIDIGNAIARLAAEALLIKGGGHKMAAGLSLDCDKIDEAMTRFDQLIARQAAQTAPNLMIDALITPPTISIATLNEIDKAGPFGQSAPAPLFAIEGARLLNRHVLKERHIKYRFAQGGDEFEVMAFGAVGGKLDLGAPSAQLASVNLALRANRNFWQGRESVQYLLEDISLEK